MLGRLILSSGGAKYSKYKRLRLSETAVVYYKRAGRTSKKEARKSCISCLGTGRGCQFTSPQIQTWGLLHDQTKALVLPPELFVKHFFGYPKFSLCSLGQKIGVAVPTPDQATAMPRDVRITVIDNSEQCNENAIGQPCNRLSVYWDFWETLQKFEQQLRGND
jgi:hypothetical protein